MVSAMPFHPQVPQYIDPIFHQQQQVPIMSARDASNPCISQDRGCRSPTNFPQFIDTQSCLCGLLDSREETRNGNQRQLWRCIGNASQNVARGDHGKWYNTSLPSEELSGINRPQNWGDNPPEASKFYILVGNGGQKRYEVPQTNDPPQLVGADRSCTGRNDTDLSGQYYQNSKKFNGGKGNDSDDSDDDQQSATSTFMTDSSSMSTSTSATSSSSSSSSSSAATSASSTSSAAAETTSASSSSTSSSPSAASTSPADKPRSNLKLALLISLFVTPLLSGIFQP